MKIINIILYFTLVLNSNATCAEGFPKELEKFKKIKRLDASYKQKKNIKSLDLTLKTTGNLRLLAPDYLEWEIHSDKLLKYVFSKKGIVFFENNIKVKEVLNNSMSSELFKPIRTLRAWLRLDKLFLKKMYKITSLTNRKYQFTPIHKDEIFKSIIITVGKNVPLKRIILNEKNGDSMSYIFSNTIIQYEN